jgi:hypothetical protein
MQSLSPAASAHRPRVARAKAALDARPLLFKKNYSKLKQNPRMPYATRPRAETSPAWRVCATSAGRPHTSPSTSDVAIKSFR